METGLGGVNLLVRGLRRIFYNSELGEVRSGWQILSFIALAFLSLILLRQILGPVRSGDEVRSAIRHLCLFPCLLGTTWLCARYLAKRDLRSVGLDWQVAWKELLFGGVVAGAGMVVLMTLILLTTGSVSAQRNQDASLLNQIVQTMGMVPAAANEELTYRGLPLQALARSFNPTVAALVLSLGFGAGHFLNPNLTLLAVVNTALAGLWLCIAYFRTRSLWLPYGLHLGWNLTLAWLGFSVSGGSAHAPLSMVDRGPNWVTGGEYGPEAGIVCTIVLVLISVWMLRTRRLAKYCIPR